MNKLNQQLDPEDADKTREKIGPIKFKKWGMGRERGRGGRIWFEFFGLFFWSFGLSYFILVIFWLYYLNEFKYSKFKRIELDTPKKDRRV